MDNMNIMSGVEQIPYDKVNVMQTLQEEALKALGREKWDEITANVEFPADNMGEEQLSHLTRELLKRFDDIVDSNISKGIFCNINHVLKHSDFSWARERFLEYGNIDLFCAAMRRETLDGFAHAEKSGVYYHGQPVDGTVLQFVKSQPYLLYGARDKNIIKAVAIPYETQRYLKETDINKKRYYACHCPFARESILQKEGPVSKTLCNCSLGHTNVFWEGAINTRLNGEVKSSVLSGGQLCCFYIYLPEKIIEEYVCPK